LVFANRSGVSTGRIVVRDRSGEIVQTVGEPILGGAAPAISPDGNRAALRGDFAVWVYDLNRNVGVRLNSAQNANNLSWTSSGREAVFREPGAGIMIQAADGSSDAAIWLDAPCSFGRTSFSSDGRYAAYGANPGTGDEEGIWYREVGSDGSFSDPISWLLTPGVENQPQISPDGRYLAYRADESGRFEIYVRPFPEGQAKWRVSTNGGSHPLWSADGGELFYIEGAALLSAPVSTANEFTVGEPQRLFESPDLLRGGFGFSYDVFPDAERFLTIERDEETPVDTVRIIDNWDAEFRDRER
jgi:Tol biopolymer transport system component